MSRFANRSVNRVDYDVLTRGDKPDRLRPEPVASTFSYDSDDVSPLAGGVLDSLVGHYHKKFAIYNYGFNEFSAGGWIWSNE